MTAFANPIASFPWRGEETLAAVRAAIARRERVEIELPAGFHHAVYACLRPHAAPTVTERLDVSGGAELLRRLARIDGLDRLAPLAADAGQAQAAVRVLSPTPTVLISFGAAPAHA